MKQAIKKYILSVLVITAFIACDKVDAPYKETVAPPPVDTSTNNNNDTTPVFDEVRKVLIEDYTGHQCGNCPLAAEKLDELKNTYGNQVVPMAVHAGFFAETAASPFNVDYRTTVATELDTYFGNSVAGNPNGMVNRKGYPNTHIQNLNAWSSILTPYTTQSPAVVLAIRNNFSASSNIVETTVYAKFKTTLTGNYKLCVYVTEDSIVGAQTDYRLNPDVVEDYHFEHMLRASFYGTWGETVATDPIASETNIIRKKYSMSLSGKLLNINHPCNVVAFVYNETSKEVIQASTKKIK
jgi:thiol-disulfide isomerase/thioredoxin